MAASDPYLLLIHSFGSPLLPRAHSVERLGSCRLEQVCKLRDQLKFFTQVECETNQNFRWRSTVQEDPGPKQMCGNSAVVQVSRQ